MEKTTKAKGGFMAKYKDSAFISYIPGLLGIVALLLVGQIVHPGFISLTNISSVLNQAAVLAVVCVGQLIVIVGTGGIDLSVGAMVSMGALIGSTFMRGSMAYLPFCILITLGLGAAFGLVNGLGVEFFKIPPLAMTLIMGTVLDGFTKAVTKGMPSLNLSETYKRIIGTPIIGRFCLIIFIALAIAALYAVILGNTKYGKSIHALGSNRTAARLCGLNVRSTTVSVYVISGAMSAIAGLILIGYVGSGQMGMGDNYTMLSIAAVVIGGAKVTGGKGTMGGAVIGAVVLMLLSTVLLTLRIPDGGRKMWQGVILIIVLMINCRLPRYRQ